MSFFSNFFNDISKSTKTLTGAANNDSSTTYYTTFTKTFSNSTTNYTNTNYAFNYNTTYANFTNYKTNFTLPLVPLDVSFDYYVSHYSDSSYNDDVSKTFFTLNYF